MDFLKKTVDLFVELVILQAPGSESIGYFTFNETSTGANYSPGHILNPASAGFFND